MLQVVSCSMHESDSNKSFSLFFQSINDVERRDEKKK